ncbi:hypothetical protein [Metallosphaera javensis (ex Sakai et al. 2022)]|uniref:hypothetical protein n=1 Tax=Metallosphaera javensis (ex Sakai et al. 2022) TaxID=2775498 RepID=UPI00258D0480|nr:MAG: hypothetical protein MjAS7_0711 [Metallosphaera javensis (ex Sakai et al. 2022)]
MKSRTLMIFLLVYASIISYIETKNLGLSIISLVIALAIFLLPRITSVLAD